MTCVKHNCTSLFSNVKKKTSYCKRTRLGLSVRHRDKHKTVLLHLFQHEKIRTNMHA